MNNELKTISEICCDIAVNGKIFYNVIVIDSNETAIYIQKDKIVTEISRDKILYINFKKKDYDLMLKRKKRLE